VNGIPYRQQGATWLLDVWVQPRAARTAVDGLHDGRLKLRLAAPPVDGAANVALVAYLADLLVLPRSAIAVARGATGRRKTIHIAAGDELAPRLSGLLESAA
jgi:uncharacterized protein (TIGR00251 family)